MTEEILEHVKGFPERNKKLEERLSGMQKTIEDGLLHPKASAQTIAMVGEVKDLLTEHIEKNSLLLEEHFKADLFHQKKTDDALQQLSELMPIVKEKLLPAYEREVNADNAKKWLKEQAKSGSFWISVIMSIAGFFYGMLFVIKQFLKP